MNLQQLRCTVCGATIDAKNIDYTKRTARCNACYETFVIEQAENFAKVEVDKTKDIQNYRENFASAIEKDDAMGMIRYAGQILDILPEDFDASYFYAYAYVKRGDSRYLYDFYDYTDREYTEDSAMRVAEHIANHCDLRDEKKALSFLRSMRYEPDTYVSLFKDTFAERVKKEELYDDITRDVFICHRSTNSDVAKRIVQELEADGNTCWISSRNLRPNDNENYWINIKKAIKSCRIFLVVSNRDAMFSGDVKKEMAFAKELNKRRIEVKIDNSEHTTFFKDFFDGCKWVKGENYEEIKTRVSNLVSKVLSGNSYDIVRNADEVKSAPIQKEKPQRKVVFNELHEHKFEKAEVVPPTCKEPGYTIYRCACGETTQKDFVLGHHSFGNWSVSVYPTCTEKGEETRQCSYCGYEETRPIDEIGHDYGEWQDSESDKEERICRNCGNIESRPKQETTASTASNYELDYSVLIVGGIIWAILGVIAGIVLGVLGKKLEWWQWQHIIGAVGGFFFAAAAVIIELFVFDGDVEEAIGWTGFIGCIIISAINIPLVFIYKGNYEIIFYWLSAYSILGAAIIAWYAFDWFDWDEDGIKVGICTIIVGVLAVVALATFIGLNETKFKKQDLGQTDTSAIEIVEEQVVTEQTGDQAIETVEEQVVTEQTGDQAIETVEEQSNKEWLQKADDWMIEIVGGETKIEQTIQVVKTFFKKIIDLEWWQWQYIIGAVGGLVLSAVFIFISFLFMKEELYYWTPFTFGTLLIVNIVLSFFYKSDYNIISYWVSGYTIVASAVSSFWAFVDSEEGFGIASIVEILLSIALIVLVAVFI